MANTFGKHWRLILVVCSVALGLWVLYLLRSAILPFGVGLALAYLLSPIVSWLENIFPGKGRWRGFKRVLALLLVFLVFAGFVGFFSYTVVTALIDSTLILLQNISYFIAKSVHQVQLWLYFVRDQLPPEMRSEVDQAIIEGGVALGNSIRDTLLKGISLAPRTFSTIFGFAVLPFFLFYVIKDSEKLKSGFYSALSPGTAAHARNIVAIIEKVLGRYIRAQLMLGLIVGYFSFIGLLLLRVQYALVLAIFAGMMEMVPTLGPWIGGAVAVIVTMAVSPDKAMWVAILFLGIQLVENAFLVPRVQSAYMRIHPAIMIFLLFMGAYIAGFWGLLLTGPLTATVVEIFKYVRSWVEKTDQPVA